MQPKATSSGPPKRVSTAASRRAYRSERMQSGVVSLFQNKMIPQHVGVTSSGPPERVRSTAGRRAYRSERARSVSPRGAGGSPRSPRSLPPPLPALPGRRSATVSRRSLALACPWF